MLQMTGPFGSELGRSGTKPLTPPEANLRTVVDRAKASLHRRAYSHPCECRQRPTSQNRAAMGEFPVETASHHTCLKGQLDDPFAA